MRQTPQRANLRMTGSKAPLFRRPMMRCWRTSPIAASSGAARIRGWFELHGRPDDLRLAHDMLSALDRVAFNIERIERALSRGHCDRSSRTVLNSFRRAARVWASACHACR